MRRANADLITQDNFEALIAAGANVMQVARDIIIARPAPLRFIALEAIPVIPAGNERQRILEELGVDTSEERVNRLLDPVTIEAIEFPKQLKGDTTGQYFEYHTLMALPRNSTTLTFTHPITRGLYIEGQIVDASDEYKELFDQTVLDIRRERGLGLASPG